VRKPPIEITLLLRQNRGLYPLQVLEGIGFGKKSRIALFAETHSGVGFRVATRNHHRHADMAGLLQWESILEYRLAHKI